METRICKCCGKELPISEFGKNAFGYISICRKCNKENRSKAYKQRKEVLDIKKEINNARMLKLKDFSPRELMTELARRGYEGKLRYVQVQEIDITNF